MSIVTVAGVEVDTRHWIGGERIASADTFEDLPLDGTVIADVSRGGRAEVDAAVAAAVAPSRPGRTSVDERAAVLHRVADGIEARIEDLAQVETGQRLAAEVAPPRRDAPGRDEHPVLRGPPAVAAPPDFDTRGHRNHVTWDPAGVTAIVTPGTRPHARDLADRSGPGGRQHGRHQAAGVGTADGVALRRHRPRGRAARRGVQRRAGPGVEAGAPLVAHPDVRRVCFTGSVPTSVRSGSRGARHDAGELRARRQVAPARLRRRRPRPRGRPGRRAVRQLRVRSASRRSACSSRTGSTTSSAPAVARAAEVTQGDSRDESVDLGPS